MYLFTDEQYFTYFTFQNLWIEFAVRYTSLWYIIVLESFYELYLHLLFLNADGKALLLIMDRILVVIIRPIKKHSSYKTSNHNSDENGDAYCVDR